MMVVPRFALTSSAVLLLILASGCDGSTDGPDDAGSEADSTFDSDGSPDGDAPDDGREGDADVRPDVEVDDDVEADLDVFDDGDSDVDTGPCPAGMVLIPEGPFVMGGPDYSAPSERPKHVVALAAYCIDRTEVTVRAYRACEADGTCPSPPLPVGPDDHPMTQVNWAAANTYCEWAGKRLPTEAQWEKAARGGCEMVLPLACGPEDERNFPWGNAADSCVFANIRRCVGGTEPVGSYPAGDSPYGLHDMAGNVAEWVADWYDDHYYETCAAGCADPTGPATGTTRIVRGGGWLADDDAVCTWFRFPLGPLAVAGALGFRCVATPRPE
jgi:formylglycine-generating enzyme required for sulfatase activity